MAFGETARSTLVTIAPWEEAELEIWTSDRPSLSLRWVFMHFKMAIEFEGLMIEEGDEMEVTSQKGLLGCKKGFYRPRVELWKERKRATDDFFRDIIVFSFPRQFLSSSCGSVGRTVRNHHIKTTKS